MADFEARHQHKAAGGSQAPRVTCQADELRQARSLSHPVQFSGLITCRRHHISKQKGVIGAAEHDAMASATFEGTSLHASFCFSKRYGRGGVDRRGNLPEATPHRIIGRGSTVPRTSRSDDDLASQALARLREAVSIMHGIYPSAKKSQRHPRNVRRQRMAMGTPVPREAHFWSSRYAEAKFDRTGHKKASTR